MNKKIISTLMLTFCFALSSQAAFADSSVGATEPNDNYEQATPILRNNADHPDERYQLYLGSLDKKNNVDDIDIFKVNLPAGENTLNVQPYYAELEVDLVDSNHNVFQHITFTQQNRQHEFELTRDQSGDFFIRITAGRILNQDKTPSYRLVVGNPYYSWGSHTERLSTLSVSKWSKTYRTVEFDLRNNSSIPTGSIVDSIRFGGRQSGSAYGRVRSAKPVSHWKWFDGKEYWFEAENMSSQYLPIELRQVWQYKHSVSGLYSDSYSLTPEVYFRYYFEQDLDAN